MATGTDPASLWSVFMAAFASLSESCATRTAIRAGRGSRVLKVTRRCKPKAHASHSEMRLSDGRGTQTPSR